MPAGTERPHASERRATLVQACGRKVARLSEACDHPRVSWYRTRARLGEACDSDSGLRP